MTTGWTRGDADAGDIEAGDGQALDAHLLAALRFAWDGIYMVTVHPLGGLLVTRADGGGSWRAGDVLDARDAIITDHGRRPMAALEAGTLGRRVDFERNNPAVKWTAPSCYHKATWAGPGGEVLEEAAPSAGALLRRLKDRGFTW